MKKYLVDFVSFLFRVIKRLTPSAEMKINVERSQNVVIHQIQNPNSNRLLLAIAVLLIILVPYQMREKIKHLLKLDKAFPKNDSKIKILFVPFKKYGCNERDDISGLIKKRIEYFNEDQKLNLALSYLNFKIDENFDSKSADNCRDYHNADMIVFGNYTQGNCSGDDKNDICLNYRVSDKWFLDTLQSNRKQTFATFQDINNEKVHGDIEFLVLYIIGLSKMKNLECQEAIKYFVEAKKKRNIPIVNQILSSCYNFVGDYKESNQCHIETLNFAKHTNDSLLTIISYSCLSLNYAYSGKLLISKKYSDSAEYIFNKIKILKLNPNSLSLWYNNLAEIKRYLSEYQLSVDYQIKSISIKKTILDSFNIDFSINYTNLATSYSYLLKVDSSLFYYQKAIDILKKDNNNHSEEFIEIYGNMANNYYNWQKYDESVLNYQKAINIAQGINNYKNANLGALYGNYAMPLMLLKKYDEALLWLKKSEKLELELFDKPNANVAFIYHNIGTVYEYLKINDSCFYYHNMALKLREKILPQNAPEIGFSYHGICKCFLILANYRKALKYENRAIEIVSKSKDPRLPKLMNTRSAILDSIKSTGSERKSHLN